MKITGAEFIDWYDNHFPVGYYHDDGIPTHKDDGSWALDPTADYNTDDLGYLVKDDATYSNSDALPIETEIRRYRNDLKLVEHAKSAIFAQNLEAYLVKNPQERDRATRLAEGIETVITEMIDGPHLPQSQRRKSNVKYELKWIVVGENNGHAKLRLDLNGDYIGEVYNAFDGGLWCALLNKRGQRGFASEEAAKSHVEKLIRADISDRLAIAKRALELYG